MAPTAKAFEGLQQVQGLLSQVTFLIRPLGCATPFQSPLFHSRLPSSMEADAFTHKRCSIPGPETHPSWRLAHSAKRLRAGIASSKEEQKAVLILRIWHGTFWALLQMLCGPCHFTHKTSTKEAGKHWPDNADPACNVHCTCMTASTDAIDGVAPPTL